MSVSSRMFRWGGYGGRAWAGNLLIAVTLVGFGFLYFTVNTAGSFRFREAKRYPNYNELAEAFLAGRLHLKYEVDPGRAAASEPNHPSLPYPFILDSLIFHGKYYFQFQPLPALIHAVWLALQDEPLPTGAVVVGAAMMNLILLGLLLQLIHRTWFREVPWWIMIYTWISFALSGVQMYIVSQPVVYHEAIVTGFTCVLAGALFFARWLVAQTGSALMAFLSGTCFGAGLGCKLTLVAYPVGFLICLVLDRKIFRQRYRDAFRQVVCFSLPILAVILLLLTYNHLRFGNFLDFGRSYLVLQSLAMYEYCCVKGSSFRLAHVPHNLYVYLVSLPDLLFRHSLPWLRFPTEYVTNENVSTVRQNMVSLFVITPALVLSFPRPGLFRYASASGSLLTIVLSCTVSSLIAFSLYLLFFGSVPRYMYEFTPLLFVTIYCSLAAAWPGVSGNRQRERMAYTLLTALLAINILMAAYAGLNGIVWNAPQ